MNLRAWWGLLGFFVFATGLFLMWKPATPSPHKMTKVIHPADDDVAHRVPTWEEMKQNQTAEF